VASAIAPPAPWRVVARSGPIPRLSQAVSALVERDLPEVGIHHPIAGLDLYVWQDLERDRGRASTCPDHRSVSRSSI